MEKISRPINSFLNEIQTPQTRMPHDFSNLTKSNPAKKKKILIIGSIVGLVLLILTGMFVLWPKNIQSPVAQNTNNQAQKASTLENANPEIANLKTEETTADNADINTAKKITGGLGEKNALKANREAKNPSDKSSNFNILVLGIDRRTGDQKSWRTDVIQLITLNPERTRAVLTHIPRDVWADKYKINAVYNVEGPDAIKDQIEKVTGQRPDRIIRIDFDAFVWAVDSVGGLTINVPNGFTDSSYPTDRSGTNEVKNVTFEKGEQKMDGEEALIYARSRKGTNGEGSDYARGLRQQYIMQAIIDDYFKPDNLFKQKTPETLYKIATEKIYTDITLADMSILYDLLKSYTKFKVENLSLNTANYLEVPSSRAAYGGAWTLIAKSNDFQPIHDKINSLVSGK